MYPASKRSQFEAKWALSLYNKKEYIKICTGFKSDGSLYYVG